MTRVLVGDAIVFEHVRLQQRVNQLIDRAQASIRQSLKLAQASGQTTMEPSLLASLAMGLYWVVGFSSPRATSLKNPRSRQPR